MMAEAGSSRRFTAVLFREDVYHDHSPAGDRFVEPLNVELR
jgi:hypothetical protein